MAKARLRLFALITVILASLVLQSCAASAPEHEADKPPPSFPVPQFLQKAATRSSWNPHVNCRATVTTLRRVLGKEAGESGGATFQGGGFKPGIPDRRALHPPCKVKRIPTFVQLRHVVIGSCDKINNDGDWTCSAVDPRLDGPLDMRRIHIETDRKFRHRTGWSRPPGGKVLRIQGFVFWDPGHTDAAWHNHSGWEIHSFTAWRRAR